MKAFYKKAILFLLAIYAITSITIAADLKYLHVSPDTVPVIQNDLSINRAQALFEIIEQDNNYIEDLTPEDLTKLPVGMKRTISNVQYTVGITQVKINPSYAEFIAFLRIKIPQ